ncbi:hypothetical protein PHLCEN_2v7138 [Hermanssonia centrifuga]|uniref:Uncharacterized protein n=1 Tax=Hermanssonia centrifuga TaxID=98765 RepID=A0A2R6NXD6_9APHY|nr:hypothetical protein PHLCEN_2v7138 [Hermanssonia centrifuga]
MALALACVVAPVSIADPMAETVKAPIPGSGPGWLRHSAQFATIEMLFSLATTTSFLTLLAAHAYANPVHIEHRDTVFPTTITAPTAGTTISPGGSFNFSYTPVDYCFEAYSPLTVWLLASSPTAADLNSTMGFSEYLFYFGQYTAADDPGM